MQAKKLKVLIIGAGFSGICMAIKLKQQGIDGFLVLEKASGIGGTWRENTYPGAECDIPSALYSYSFEHNPKWAYKWSGQKQILQYQKDTADKYQINQYMKFNVEVVHSQFVEAENYWLVTTSEGEQFIAQHLISAVGQLHHPSIPDISGSEHFQGDSFHSARWDHTIDFTNKRVAVIGNAASAVQFIPEIAKQVAQLTIFQRSPNWILPKINNASSAFGQWVTRYLPLVDTLNRFAMWLKGEVGIFPAIKGNRFSRWILRIENRRLIKKSIRDEQLIKKLTPDYPIGAKRILFADEYYPALARENVLLETTAIKNITQSGITCTDGSSSDFDVIIYATGFKTNPFLSPMEFIGMDGLSLRQKWAAGAHAYLGVVTSGFPNLFMMYGPNTNLGHNSIIIMIEAQAKYIVECITALDARSSRSLNVREQVESDYNDRLQKRLHKLAFDEVEHSWYKDGDKITNNWAGGTREYMRSLRKVDWDAYHLN